MWQKVGLEGAATPGGLNVLGRDLEVVIFNDLEQWISQYVLSLDKLYNKTMIKALF
jgi:hypothetical protein